MHFYDHIDWNRAWYASLFPCAQSVIGAHNWRHEINQLAQQQGLLNHQNLPLQFIPQEELPEGIAYESHISQTGKVPTRENLHDFFNALVWLNFPHIKRQLNAMQAAQIKQFGIGKSRGSARDAATIFDENAALLIINNDLEGQTLYQHLRSHEWKAAFIEHADLFQDGENKKVQVWSFGHALMEKLVTPYKAITAHAFVVWVDDNFFQSDFFSQRQAIDTHVSQFLQQQSISTADYTPLPVLGIPHWWETQDDAFYADTLVFRPKRIGK